MSIPIVITMTELVLSFTNGMNENLLVVSDRR